MRLLTLTLNPAIDLTISLDHLVPGEVHRARASRSDPGGKGINVASVLADWGLQPAAHGLLGRDNAAPFEALFAAKGIADKCLRVAGATRTNLKLVDAADTTDINMDGPAITPEEAAAALAGVVAEAGPDALVVLAGSLPAACPPDTYAEAVAALRGRGARVLLDTSGAALQKALAAAVLPDVIKPNRRELADWAGRPLATMGDVLRVAGDLRARGVALVVVSMGAEGALFVGAGGALLARLAAGPLASTVGAGD
ncbi:MAG TPA: 1-phosphofructokinase family hexose kinase, partial [Novosphingobium sp.]|nr:1-phosphofructokinase family hexose kinase [Novosphingobium sp.]